MDNTQNVRELLIRLLLASGLHDEVEAEMHTFLQALNAENWCREAVYWRLVNLWNGPRWELIQDQKTNTGAKQAERRTPEQLLEGELEQGVVAVVGNHLFYLVNPELLIETELIEGAKPDVHFREALKIGFDKFSNHLNRRLNRKKEKEKRKHETNPIELLASDPALQQRVMATLSHELRNPLNLIIGYANILLDTQINPALREYVSVIKDSGTGLYQNIKKVFQFLHVMMDKLVDEEMEFRIRDVIAMLENQLMPHIVAKGLQWKLSLPKEAEMWLKGDMPKLYDILLYLLENALKFSSQGAIELIVSYEGIDEDEKGPRFGFLIRDQGKGIDALNQLRVFNFFNQEDDSITRNYGGLGLGLSLAEVFVRRLGGHLVLKSAVGLGSLFIFQITFSQAADAERLDLANQMPEPELTANIPILIADDDLYQRKMAAHILRHWKLGFAENGLQAVEYLRSNPDTRVVLMDIRMPEMDGIQATRLIRNELGFSRPIIAVSGEALETTIEECFDAGMNAFVSKPFDADQLVRAVILQCDSLHEQMPGLKKLRRSDRLTGLSGLLVEDNKMIQLLTMRYLRDMECKAELATDLRTAFEKISQNHYDFVLLDLNLPDGSGFDLARKLKPVLQNTCLIAYSGEDSEQTRDMCEQTGIDGIILKAYHTAEELAMKINRIFDQFQPQPPQSVSNSPAEPSSDIQTSAQLQSFDNQYSNSDYDLSKVKEIIGSNSSDLVLLLEVFLEHSGTSLNNLLEANRKGDQKSLSRLAHSLKSSAKQFGMERAAELLFALEQRSGTLSLDERNAMCQELEQIFGRTLPAIAREVELLKS